jgi:hypothetical protein
MKMNEATEGVRELHPHASHYELVQSETEFNRLVDDYKTLGWSLKWKEDTYHRSYRGGS